MVRLGPHIRQDLHLPASQLGGGAPPRVCRLVTQVKGIHTPTSLIHTVQVCKKNFKMCLKLSLSATPPSSKASDWRTCSTLFLSSTTTTTSFGKGAENCGEVCGVTASNPLKFQSTHEVWLPSDLSLCLRGLPCSGGGVCSGVWWSQLLFCCGSSGGFMLCLASVIDHFWCAEPIFKSCTTSCSTLHPATCITLYSTDI